VANNVARRPGVRNALTTEFSTMTSANRVSADHPCTPNVKSSAFDGGAVAAGGEVGGGGEVGAVAGFSRGACQSDGEVGLADAEWANVGAHPRTHRPTAADKDG